MHKFQVFINKKPNVSINLTEDDRTEQEIAEFGEDIWVGNMVRTYLKIYEIHHPHDKITIEYLGRA